MQRKFLITYRLDGEIRTCECEARSKYDAKRWFYVGYPKAEIVKVEVIDSGKPLE